MDSLQQTNDAIAIAYQLGRLDLVSLLLAAIGLILVMGGLFAFFNFRAIAKAQATAEATKVAERIANEYLQRELPDVIKAYRDMMDSSDLSDEAANEMASAQDDTTDDKK